MKKTTKKRAVGFFVFIALTLSTVRSIAIAAGAEVRPGRGPTIEAAQAQLYDGPKASITVADFEDRTSSSGQYRGEYGRGMADMLTTALFNTNRYILIERQKPSYVQDPGQPGGFYPQTVSGIGGLEGAELLLLAAVTRFDPGVPGGSGGLGVGGMLGSFFGSEVRSAIGNLAVGLQTADIAIELRLIDTKTGQVVAADSVAGKATEFTGSLGVTGTPISGTLGGFAKTPMEKAIRAAIQASVDFVASKTPPQHYRFLPVAAPAPMPDLQAGLSPQPQTGFGPQPFPQPPFGSQPPQPPFGHQPQPGLEGIPQQSIPMLLPTLKAITANNNPNLNVELTEVRRRGATVSVVVIVRNITNTEQRLDYQQQGTHLLDYLEAKTYELISGIQGRRSTRLAPNEQAVIRATFRAPPQAQAVAIVIDELGTFDDVALEPISPQQGIPAQPPQVGQPGYPNQPGVQQQPGYGAGYPASPGMPGGFQGGAPAQSGTWNWPAQPGR